MTAFLDFCKSLNIKKGVSYMLQKYISSVVMTVIITLTFIGVAASAFGAEAGGGRYHLVPIKEGETTYTYMIDVEKGDVYEVKAYKTSKGNMEHYLKYVPEFDKDKDVLKWITEMEKTPAQ